MHFWKGLRDFVAGQQHGRRHDVTPSSTAPVAPPVEADDEARRVSPAVETPSVKKEFKIGASAALADALKAEKSRGDALEVEKRSLQSRVASSRPKPNH